MPILDQLLGMLGMGGGQPSQPAQDPTMALMQSMGMQVDPQAAQAYQQAMQQQQDYARNMALAQTGLGILGAHSTNQFPISGLQAIGQGAQQGLSTYDQLRQQQGQQLQRGLQTMQALQGLKGGQMQLQSQQAMQEATKALLGLQQGVIDPQSAMFIMQSKQAPIQKAAYEQMAQDAALKGDANNAQLYRWAANNVMIDPSGIAKTIAEKTYMTPAQAGGLKLRERAVTTGEKREAREGALDPLRRRVLEAQAKSASALAASRGAVDDIYKDPKMRAQLSQYVRSRIASPTAQLELMGISDPDARNAREIELANQFTQEFITAQEALRAGGKPPAAAVKPPTAAVAPGSVSKDLKGTPIYKWADGSWHYNPPTP